MSELIFSKKGDFKSGILSKKNAGEIEFYKNKIVFKPKGISKFFNSAPITINKNSILEIKSSFRVLGYSYEIETNDGKYFVGFMSDKNKIEEIINSYLS
ncbi:hypothetical protein [Gaetbulibacter jejuensis]|uniref:hypothetical protein n=1 Tax=Gaetbulibacter jejuensis TaxID=584607 RepID=UPI00300A4496